ncbi:ABC transporter ATP-binding protein [Chloroflexota bacterium]
MSLLEVKDLKTYFFTRRGVVKAVDGVSFSLEKGKTLGLVGESGCGKSITCLSIMRLISPPGRIIGGKILLDGEDILSLSEKEMQRVRGKRVSIILQDPMSSLNPAFSVGDQVGEAIRKHQGTQGTALREKNIEMLKLVRVSSPEVRIDQYPHQFSGGMRQRVVGAIALSCQPRVLIADEPTTSLDVTIQLQYLKLLKDIQQKSQLGVIFITHDFGVAARVCDTVAVMYAGKIVEVASIVEFFANPLHPYTQALMGSVCKPGQKVERLYSIEGQPPRLDELPPGCSFAPRCQYVYDKCRRDPAPTLAMIHKEHSARCWKLEQP